MSPITLPLNDNHTQTFLTNWSSTTNETDSPCDFSMVHAEACGNVKGAIDSFGHPATICCAIIGIFLNVVVIIVICHAMKQRQTQAQIHLLTLAFSDLAYVICCSNLAIVSWSCDACLPCPQLGRCHTVILVAGSLWVIASSTNRCLILVITGLRARAIKNPFQQHANQDQSARRVFGELIGYTVLSSGTLITVTEIVKYLLIQNGASRPRTLIGTFITHSSLWIVVMLSLATYILVKLRYRNYGGSGHISNAEADFQRLVALVAIVFSVTHVVGLVNSVVVLAHNLQPQGPWGAFSSTLNSSINFFIYLAASNRFKNAFWGWWRS